MPQETQHTEQSPATTALPCFARYLERVSTGQPAAMRATTSSQAGGQCLPVKTRVKAGVPGRVLADGPEGSAAKPFDYDAILKKAEELSQGDPLIAKVAGQVRQRAAANAKAICYWRYYCYWNGWCEYAYYCE